MGDEKQSIIPGGGAEAAALAALAAVHTPRPRVELAGADAIERPGVPPGAPSVWNANGSEWGAPMVERVSAEGTSRGKAPPGTPQESSSAWGRQANVTPGSQPTGVIRVQLQESTSFTLSIDVLQEASAKNGLTGVTCFVWAKVTFGNGAANIQRNVRCDYRIDAPLVGSYIDVLLYIGDASGNPISASAITTSVPAIVVAQLSRGVRATAIQGASLYTTDFGVITSAASALDGPQRLMSVAAHLAAPTGGAEVFLQLFDSVHGGGVGSPVAEWPLGATPAASGIAQATRLKNPRGFVNGIVWAMSQTSGSLTGGGFNVWIELETQLL